MEDGEAGLELLAEGLVGRAVRRSVEESGQGEVGLGGHPNTPGSAVRGSYSRQRQERDWYCGRPVGVEGDGQAHGTLGGMHHAILGSGQGCVLVVEVAIQPLLLPWSFVWQG